MYNTIGGVLLNINLHVTLYENVSEIGEILATKTDGNQTKRRKL